MFLFSFFVILIDTHERVHCCRFKFFTNVIFRNRKKIRRSLQTAQHPHHVLPQHHLQHPHPVPQHDSGHYSAHHGKVFHLRQCEGVQPQHELQIAGDHGEEVELLAHNQRECDGEHPDDVQAIPLLLPVTQQPDYVDVWSLPPPDSEGMD